MENHDPALLMLISYGRTCSHFNLNLLKYCTDDNVKFYVDDLHGVGCQFLIDKPTRIWDGKCSLVDHILTNDMQNTITPGILLADASDHLPTFLVLKNMGPELSPFPRMIRDYSKFKQSVFLKDLSTCLEPLKHIKNGENCNNIFQNFLSILNKVRVLKTSF